MVAEIGQQDILPTNQQPVDIGFGLAMADEDQLGCLAIGMMKAVESASGQVNSLDWWRTHNGS
jgi:hypothetical protein